MPIPDYQTLMLPLLTLAADGNEHRFRDAVEQLAAEFELSDSERATMHPSGTAPMFDNRVGWAKTYLKTGWFDRRHSTGLLPDHVAGLRASRNQPGPGRHLHS